MSLLLLLYIEWTKIDSIVHGIEDDEANQRCEKSSIIARDGSVQLCKMYKEKKPYSRGKCIKTIITEFMQTD